MSFRLLLIFNFFVFSFYSSASVSEFLSTIDLVTYDCPPPESYEQSVKYSQIENQFSNEERLHLGVIHAHHLICNGRAQDAEEHIRPLIIDLNHDKSSKMYARGIYMLGLALDFQEKHERCEQYIRSRELSEDFIEDVNVSSKLGLIVYCSKGLSRFEKLEDAYQILQEHLGSQDKGLIAHIYNSIGFLYANSNMHYLAAEQFLKGHDLGYQVYRGSNKLSMLSSAIVSLLSTRQYDEVARRLSEYKTINKEINTPTTNFWYLMQKANFDYHKADYDALDATLKEWGKMRGQLANQFYDVYLELYEAKVCLVRNDRECVERYINNYASFSEWKKRVLQNSEVFAIFSVKAHILIEKNQEATLEFDKFLNQLNKKVNISEINNAAIQLSNLREKIGKLEQRLSSDNKKDYSLLPFIAVFVVLLALVLYLKSRKLPPQDKDVTTGLYNPESVVKQLKKIDAPEDRKSHAIAIFDIQNFREANRALGMTKSEFILQRVANTLKSVTREKDLIGRLATEQFILCLINIEEGSANNFISRTKKAIETSLIGNEIGPDFILESKVSVYATTEKFKDVEELLQDMMLSIDIG